jgi:hypothetical protein
MQLPVLQRVRIESVVKFVIIFSGDTRDASHTCSVTRHTFLHNLLNVLVWIANKMGLQKKIHNSYKICNISIIYLHIKFHTHKWFHNYGHYKKQYTYMLCRQPIVYILKYKTTTPMLCFKTLTKRSIKFQD